MSRNDLKRSDLERRRLVKRIDDAVLNGLSIVVVCKKYGMTATTYYRWKKTLR